METEGKKPYQKTSSEQLEFFLEFCRKHPKIRQNKNDPSNLKRMQNLWGDLAVRLNALKGPTRTAVKWKEVRKYILSRKNHWKVQVRSRARKQKVAAKLTGGGPPSNSLSELEQRALETFDGGLLIDGIPNVPSLGMQEIADQILECDEESSAQIIELEGSLIDSSSNNLESLPSPSATKSSQLDKMFHKACEMIKSRQESDRCLQQQLIEQQQQLLQQQHVTVTALKALTDVIADIKNK